MTGIRAGRAAGRAAAALLAAAAALALAGCATSSSTDQVPIGQKPAVTVLIRVRSPAGPQVQLLGAGVDPAALGTSATAVAAAVLPSSQPGSPRSASATAEGLRLASVAVPITVPDDAFSFSVDDAQMDQALQGVQPKSLAVWACTDDRRTIQVTTQAPGSVSSDVESGSCRIVGSSIAQDGITWTASVAVGALQPPSLLPVAITTSIVLVLVTLAIALLRGHAASRRAPTPEPSEAPVD